MRYQQRQRLFTQHAAAVLRRDTAEAARLETQFGPDQRLPHQLFTFALFASTVTDHFGDDLDHGELADLMTEIRAAHPGLHWLRAEALIRACYGQTELYLDVPASDHYRLMWTVLTRLVPPDPGETTLSVLFDRADKLGREIVSGIFETERLYGWADEHGDHDEHDKDKEDGEGQEDPNGRAGKEHQSR